MRKWWLFMFVVMFSCQSNTNENKSDSNTNHSEVNTVCALQPLSSYKVLDENGDTILFSNLIQEDYTLLVTYTGSVCRPCLEEYVSFFNELVNGQVDKNKILFISHYPNLRSIKVDRLSFGFNVYKFVLKEDCAEIPSLIEGYVRLILINNDLEIIHNRYGFPDDSLSNPDFLQIIPYLK